MKKLISIVVLTLLMMVTAASVSAKIITIKRAEWIGPGHVIKWQEYRTDRGVAVKHGLYVEMLDDKIILEGEYCHGLRHGRWVRWSSHGQYRLMEIMIYDNGRLLDDTRPVNSKKYSKTANIKRSPVISISLPHLRVYGRL